MTDSMRNYEAVVPSDSTVLRATVGIYIGTGGDVSVTSREGRTVVFKNAPSGITLWIEVVKVNATSTTATDIVALR